MQKLRQTVTFVWVKCSLILCRCAIHTQLFRSRGCSELRFSALIVLMLPFRDVFQKVGPNQVRARRVYTPTHVLRIFLTFFFKSPKLHGCQRLVLSEMHKSSVTLLSFMSPGLFICGCLTSQSCRLDLLHSDEERV